MKKKTIAKAAAVLPLAGAALFTEELYRYVFCRKPSSLFCRLFDQNGHEEGYYTAKEEAAKRLRASPCETYFLRSERGERLQGYYYPCGGEGKRIAFLVHGYRSEHAVTAGIFYDYYKSRGVDLFCCDNTGSGESEGRFIGFDVYETEDCLGWLRFLRERFGPDVQILLHGFSMGAATVMRMSSRCPDNVRFIVEDSGFSCARASMDHMIGPMYQPLRLINRAVAGYDWDDSDVTESLAKASVPILFVHGREDGLVPFENGPRLYELYSGPKDCFFPEHTKHIESMYTCPEEYARRLDNFLGLYFDKRED